MNALQTAWDVLGYLLFVTVVAWIACGTFLFLMSPLLMGDKAPRLAKKLLGR